MNSTGLLNPDRTVTPYGNTGGGSGGDEIQWITKEEWDAMTPEQKSDPNITYGVRGLGNPMNEDVLVAEVNADGIKTYSEILNEICSLALADNNTFDNSYYLVIYFNYSNNIQYFSYHGIIGSLYAFSLSHVTAGGSIFTQCIRLGTSNSLFRTCYINADSTIGYENNDSYPMTVGGKISLYKRR